MVFTREKHDTSNQNRERCFFTCEKNDTSNQKPQRCVSFGPKFPPFIAACSAASHTFYEKSFTQRVFLAKKVKNISEWNSFVCFTVDKENGREPAKQQRKGINRTRRKLLLCFLSELLCQAYIETGHFTWIHSFSIVHWEQTVKITCSSWITSYPYCHLCF